MTIEIPGQIIAGLDQVIAGFQQIREGVSLLVPAPPSSGDYWNPSDRSSGASLSNSDKTVAFNTAFNEFIRGVVGHATGKKYFEQLVTTVDEFLSVGFANASFSPAGTYLGDVNSCAYSNWLLSTNGYLTPFGGFRGTTNKINNGTIIGWALDFDNGQGWMSYDGQYLFGGNPSTLTGPDFTIPANTYFPAAATQGTATNSSEVALRTKSGDFSFAPPAGFDPWA